LLILLKIVVLRTINQMRQKQQRKVLSRKLKTLRMTLFSHRLSHRVLSHLRARQVRSG